MRKSAFVRTSYSSSPTSSTSSLSSAMAMSNNNVGAEPKKLRGIGAVVVVFLLLFTVHSLLTRDNGSNSARVDPVAHPQTRFDHHFSSKYSSSSTSYDFAMVADMDKDSKRESDWMSILKHGTLHRQRNGNYSVTWGEENVITSKFNEGGRGMELSALVNFQNRLLAFDDRTGVVFDLKDGRAVPVQILMNGDGNRDKGFKAEWAAVKDDKLYVGSMGKEWTNNNGDILNQDPQWVKVLDSELGVTHVSWVDNYNKIRSVLNADHPGYVLHESAGWHPLTKRWYFLPRRVSSESYNDEADELRGSNIVVSADETFDDIQYFRVGKLNPSHGFSAFKFLPHRENEVVAIKTEELKGTIRSYLMVFDLDGKVLMDETRVPSDSLAFPGIKYEGIEITY